MNPRKSHIRDLLLNKDITPELATSAEVFQEAANPERPRSSAVNTMADTIHKLTADAEAGRALREQINSGASVVEIEPDLVEPSFVSDRIVIGEDQAFHDLVKSIEHSGQQIPVLVRPHPETSGRYQIAYGHRRLRAAKLLGRKVRAVIRVMESKELVIAQGTENSARRDLSFIERARFASNLEIAGFDRETMMAALSVGKPEVARLLSVAASVEAKVVYAIGPAPKAGRNRWMGLARMLQHEELRPIVEQLMADPLFQAGDTDTRFVRLFNALDSREAPKRAAQTWQNPNGQAVVKIERTKTKTRLIIDERLAPQFGSFLASKLDELYADFSAPDRGEAV